MDVRALHKWVRISPQKVRRYCRLVRGKPAQDAIGILGLDSSPSAFELRRALLSAVANAENNHDLDPEDLVVKDAQAGDATRMRRMLPRARGRADVIRKRSCHILVVVSDEGAEERGRRQPPRAEPRGRRQTRQAETRGGSRAASSRARR